MVITDFINRTDIIMLSYIRYCSNATSHMRVYWLVHTHVQICVPLRVMEHLRVSLTVHACYMKGCIHAYAALVDTYIGTYMYATRMLPTRSRQSLRRIVPQGTY